ETVAPFITERWLATVIKDPEYYAPLLETLRPLRKPLLIPLSAIFRNPGGSESARYFATSILADYAAEEPDVLAVLLMDADPKASAILFPVAARLEEKTLRVFQAKIRKDLASEEGEDSEQDKDTRAQRQARAAVALIRMNPADEQVWRLLRHSNDP